MDIFLPTPYTFPTDYMFFSRHVFKYSSRRKVAFGGDVSQCDLPLRSANPPGPIREYRGIYIHNTWMGKLYTQKMEPFLEKDLVGSKVLEGNVFVSNSEINAEKEQSFHHTSYLSRAHERGSCKFFLAGVNFFQI